MSRRHIATFFVIILGGILLPTAEARQAPTPAGTLLPEKPAAQTDRLYREARYQPSNRRDPFLNPLLLIKNVDLNEELPRGEAPPGIAGMYIAQVKLVGVSLGEDSRTAVFEGTDKRVYFLREGDRFFDGYLKEIAADAVLMIRERNLRSGKTQTDEVTKRLRTP
ncbi:MAG: hypothetical protein ABIG68_10195 [Acidobacteriota bacterium]